MLRNSVGELAFLRGLAGYMRLPPGEPAGVEELMREISLALDEDVGPFLEPWIHGTRITDLDVRIAVVRLVIRPVVRLGDDAVPGARSSR